MRIWHGYLLLTKPGVISQAEWFDILSALRAVLDHIPDDWNIARRLHWRFSLDATEVLIVAAFNRDDIDIENISRLAAYIQAVVPRFTVEQVRDTMRDYITLFGGAQGTTEESAAAALQYIGRNKSAWELDIP